MDQVKNEQIKSKRRSADHQEVFTAEREVNAIFKKQYNIRHPWYNDYE